MLAEKALMDVVNDDDFWRRIGRQISARITPIARGILFSGIDQAQAAGAIVDMDAIHEPALWVTENMSSIYWAKIERTTRDALRTTLMLWQQQGLGKRGLPDLVAALTDPDHGMFTRARAKRIAQTESTRLFAEGNELAVQYDDAVIGMEWQTVGPDELTCLLVGSEPGCAPRHGLIYPKNNLPNIPLHVGCRCGWLPATLEYVRAHIDKWQGGELPAEAA